MTAFNFLTTHVGSVPHPTLDGRPGKLTRLLDVPAWPQLPRRSFREDMYTQYSPTLLAVREDRAHEKTFFDTKGDLSEALDGFYTPVLAEDVDAFALRPEYANGFFAKRETLRSTTGESAKGKVKSHVRQLAIELGHMDIGVSAIMAGVTDTPALRKIPGNKEMIKVAEIKNPRERLTTPEDVAKVISLLSRDGGEWISGGMINADGGEDIVSFTGKRQ